MPEGPPISAAAITATFSCRGCLSQGLVPRRLLSLCPAAGAGNDYQKDIQFRKLNAKKDELQIKVVRDAKELLIPNTELVVGDLVLLVTGDKIVADGLCVESHGLVADEASLTGESDPLKKGPEDPFCRAGTQVSYGMGAGSCVADSSRMYPLGRQLSRNAS